MPHHTPLISTIVAALVLAFVLGAIATFEGGQAVAQALNPDRYIIARSHSDEEIVHLKSLGATRVIMGEEEIGLAMLAELARL